MKKYKFTIDNSPLINYQICGDVIGVCFNKRKKSPFGYTVYINDNYHLQQLIQISIAGKGLSAYINQNVRNDFIQ